MVASGGGSKNKMCMVTIKAPIGKLPEWPSCWMILYFVDPNIKNELSYIAENFFRKLKFQKFSIQTLRNKILKIESRATREEYISKYIYGNLHFPSKITSIWYTY